MIYEKIYDFCRVRNHGSVFSNSNEEYTPRVKFLINLLNEEGIEHEVVPQLINKGNLSFTIYNIVMRGTSDKMVIAHHDVNNHTTDNANDNSASVINAIAIKKLRPDVHVVLTDGEEFGGLGARLLSNEINNGVYGDISWVLNLELTGRGGDKFFIGTDNNSALFNLIKERLDCPDIRTPFNDAVILKSEGIDSVVINPLPVTDRKTPVFFERTGEYLDYSYLFNCHSPKDTIDTISVEDMKVFVEDVVMKILR